MSADVADIARRVAASAVDGEQVEAYVAHGRRYRVRAYDGQVESVTSAESSGIGIRIVVGGLQGFAHAGSLDPAVVDEVLAEARDNVRFGEPDPHYGLAEPDGVRPAELALYRADLAAMGPERKVELALELERAVRAGDPRIFGVRSASYGDGVGESAIATSTGVFAWSEATSCSISVLALARDGDETQTGSGFSAGRGFDDLDLAATVSEAVDDAVSMLGATKPPSRRARVALDPSISSSVFGIVGGMLTGERVLKGRSPFADRVGDVIASPLVTLVDDATDAKSLAADPHDGEGLATRPTSLVSGGVLQGFLHNVYSGRRSGSGTTASAVRGYASTPGVGCLALHLTPGTQMRDEIIAGIDDGVYLTSVSGLHSGVNSVSGDFSVGASGFVIRSGQLAEPIKEFTIAGTIQRMLQDVGVVGGDIDRRYGDDAVTIVIDDLSISGR